MKAQRPCRHAKKSHGHNAFRMSWAMYAVSALNLPEQGSRHTSQEETAMQEYKTLQTGPKTDAGGAQPGRTNVP